MERMKVVLAEVTFTRKTDIEKKVVDVLHNFPVGLLQVHNIICLLV